MGICFSRAHQLWLYCGPVEGFDPGDDLELTNATVELESTDYDNLAGYVLRVTPTVWSQPVIIKVKGSAVTDGAGGGGARSGTSSMPSTRQWNTAASATQRAGPAVTGIAWGGDANGDGRWGAGEAVEAHLTFDASVEVRSDGGTPAVTLLTAGTRVATPYARGTGTKTLVFSHPVGAGNAAVDAVLLEANSLVLNGGRIVGTDGADAALAHSGAGHSAPRFGAAPLTARFEEMPDEHDRSAFSFVLRLSEDPVASNRVFRHHAFELIGGRVIRSRRIEENGARQRAVRRIAVVPDGYGTVRIMLPPTLDCAAEGAICTADGRALSTPVAATVPGPAALSVADAEVREGRDAALAFAVTLDRAASDTVTVDYATSDETAVAGEDYTAVSGTLTFAAGETSKTVSVAVLDDAHDEGSETLTLTLSNAEGARIADDEATGTIVNSDAMPKAWLARFGRTVAEQVLDAVGDRLAAPPRAGTEASLAGQRIASGAGSAAATDEASRLKEAEAAQARPAAMSEWLQRQTDGDRDGRSRWRTAALASRARLVTERDLLIGTSFALTAQPDPGGYASLWGRGAISRFDGREGTLILDGEVATGMLGADWTRGAWTAGLALAQSRGEGGYRDEDVRGTVEATLTGVYPYGRHALNERVTLWGLAGYGSGALTLTPEGVTAMATDIDLKMAALGLRGVLVEAPDVGGPELAAVTDGFIVRTTSAALRSHGGNLAASQAQVTRLRLGLEGTWHGFEPGGGEMTPRVEVGMRRDGGDAETGFGLDLGGALAWRHTRRGIAAEVSGRGLLSHEAGGFRDRGVSGALSWDPRPDSQRGVRLTLAYTVGASSTGGVDALLGRPTLAGLAGDDDYADAPQRRRMDLRLGYGFSALGDRFTSIPQLGLGLSDSAREASLGWRLALTQRGSNALELGIEATRRAPVNDDREPEHAIDLRLRARW